MKILNPNKFCLLLLCVTLILTLGCGSSSSQAILPGSELTEEQKAAIKADDARIDDEESQGKMNKPKSKKQG